MNTAQISRLTTQDLYKLQPAIPRSLLELGNLAAQGLEPSLVHLIKARVSQINGCAYCLSMHMNEARQDGEDQARLDVLAAWREASLFTPGERAALAFAEALTHISEGPVGESVFRALADQFEPEQIANITAVTLVINSWNRIAITFALA